MKKRLLSLGLALYLALTLLPMAALATPDPSENDPTASIAASSLYFRENGGEKQYSTDNVTWTSYIGAFTITGSNVSDTVITNTVIVLSGTHDITLSDCAIGAKTSTGTSVSGALSPFDIQGGTVSLTLSGSSILYSANQDNAALRVASGTSLTISGSGSLDARCQKNYAGYYGIGAGIGGSAEAGNGSITIAGGAVSAYSFNGAGIGGGYSASVDFGSVTISGGMVYAQSDWGCGIGYGSESSSASGTVTVTGGSVRAVLGQNSNYNPIIGGTVQNGSSTSVQLYTLTLSGVSTGTAVTGLTTTEALGYTYGTAGMKTEAGGVLYVYLPADKTEASVTTAAGTYSGTITDNAAGLSFQLPTAALCAADASSPADYVLDTGNKTIIIKTDKGAAYWSASGDTYLNYDVLLDANINVSGFLWTPVGADLSSPFSGTFDGQGHTITGLTVDLRNGPDAAYTGLFGVVSSGMVKNVTVSGSVSAVSADIALAGGIAGVTIGTDSDLSYLENCVSNMTVSADNNSDSTEQFAYAGGLVGMQYYTHTINCVSTGSVTAFSESPEGWAFAGGLAGMVTTEVGSCVNNSYNTGTVNAAAAGIAGKAYAGGIAGVLVSDYLRNCYNTGTVSASYTGDTGGAGGIAGYVSGGTVLYCYYLSSKAAKGIIYSNDGTVTGCGTFETSGALTAGTADSFLSEQTLANGTALLTALNGWVDTQASGDFYTWQADIGSVNSGYPVFGAEWDAPQTRWGLAGTDGSAPTSWTSGSLDDAMTYANGLSSGTAYIQLQSDIDTTATLIFSGGTTTILDLNSKTIDANHGNFSVLTVIGNLTLCDSSTATAAAQGKITGGNSSDFGGGVYIESVGSFTMTGGNITGNTSGTSGGGVFGNSNVMTMTGGSITGNHTKYNGGGVFLQGGTFTVGGTANITGNTSGTAPDTIANNVYLYGSMSPPAQQILTISTAAPLTTGASIGVRTAFVPSAASPLTFTGESSADYSGYFTSDNSNYVVKNGGTDSAQVVQLALYTTPAYPITANTALNGSYTVKVDGSEVTSAQSGATVTVTPAASSGYEVDTITVCKTGDTSATVTVGDNTFTMPAYAVTVTVTFKTASGSLDLTGVGCDVAAGKLTGTTANMQYSLDGGVTWQDCAADNTTGLTFIEGTVKVRQKDSTANEHAVITIAAAAASIAPALSSKTYSSVTLTFMAGYEYSRDGGTTWQDSPVFSGLSGGTAYSFVARIKATAAALPGTISTALSVTTNSASSGGGTSPSTGTPVIVDGKTVNIGTEKKFSDTTTVTVDQSKLSTNIASASSGSSVVVPIGENGVAAASLVVKNIEDMADKSMTLTIQTGNVAYNLNTSAIDMAALETAFPGADMSKVPFDVTIQSSSVSVAGETLVLSPVEFTVTATYDGKSVSVDTYSAYVDRMIDVTAEQAAKIATAVVVNADGSTRHVPTNVVEKDGKYYAIINSRTNSTYALVQNDVTFADADGKWYEAVVNEMGSRKIIEGRGASVFDGEAITTRAEFAVILVRALGLPADGTSSFSDVPTDAWYTGAVSTAVQYGLTDGRSNNCFDPSVAITRQEAMLMLQRAAKLTEFTGTSGDLDSFADADIVETWARDAAEWSVGSGIIQGADGKLNPTADITRAESATIILRLLQKAGLVDVRSKA